MWSRVCNASNLFFPEIQSPSASLSCVPCSSWEPLEICLDGSRGPAVLRERERLCGWTADICLHILSPIHQPHLLHPDCTLPSHLPQPAPPQIWPQSAACCLCLGHLLRSNPEKCNVRNYMQTLCHQTGFIKSCFSCVQELHH